MTHTPVDRSDLLRIIPIFHLMQVVQNVVNSSVEILSKLDKNHCNLKHIKTYHTPMTHETDRVKYVDFRGSKFKNARRRLEF